MGVTNKIWTKKFIIFLTKMIAMDDHTDRHSDIVVQRTSFSVSFNSWIRNLGKDSCRQIQIRNHDSESWIWTLDSQPLFR